MHLPSYSIGSKVYDKIPEICEPYGTKVIAIGGHKAINAAKDKIIKACEKSNLEILDRRPRSGLSAEWACRAWRFSDGPCSGCPSR